jgi:hypothetical protein
VVDRSIFLLHRVSYDASIGHNLKAGRN